MEPVLEPEEPPDKICGICGGSHNYNDCVGVKIEHYVKDKPVLSKARLSLPANLRIQSMSEGSYSVCTTELIEKGTCFGPFDAKKLFNMDVNVQFPLKVFQSTDYFKEYYLDNSNEFECNWMYFVQPATNIEEQNLICFEDKSNIYYVSIKKILPGEYLRVWYSSYYAQKMNKSVLNSDESEEDNSHGNIVDINELVQKQQKIRVRKIWMCKFCSRQDFNVTSFAIHIIEHYKMQMRKTCEICKETFQTRQSLKKHVTLVHCNVGYANNITLDKQKNKTEYTKTGGTNDSKTDNVVGGPLLNEIAQDTFDNTNVLLEHMMLSNFDMDQTNGMLENDNLNLGVDNLLTENVNFNFNIEESNETFVCDICLKNFTKLQLLLKHLVTHSGKYTCTICLKVFCRNENFVSHSCNSTSKFTCNYCTCKFSLKKYLTKHIALKHKREFICSKECKQVFPTKNALDAHKCVPELTIVACNICPKQFLSMRNLNRHKKIHNARESKVNLCEVCSKLFPTKKLLMQHMNTHSERRFQCDICDKRFVRKTTYLDHIEIHKKSKVHVCTVCGKKFALKKYLTNHMTTMHNHTCKHPCPDCPQMFRQKSNLRTHYNRIHRKKCANCTEVFDTAEQLKAHNLEHKEQFYECQVCQQITKLRSSMLRHIKKKHSQENINLKTVKPAESKLLDENIDNNNSNSDDIVNLLNLKEKDVDSMQDIDSNFDYIVNNYDPNSFNVIEGDKTTNTNLVDAVIDFTSLDMDFEQNFNMQQDAVIDTHEVCLSMPELTDIEQNITLGENAYILDNGTIIEPIEQGKVVLYILDKEQKSLIK